MTLDDRILDLLKRWEDARERGQPITPEELCKDFPELLDEIKRRIRDLQHLQSTGGQAITESPVTDGTIIETPGTSVGPYKLLQRLGEGGMGTVWQAKQTEPVRRKVAIKLIKLGMDSKQVLARFEAERQALALMDHPNIAKVLDAGTTSAGRPYFVMELVKGLKITKYCDEARLTVRERLELFIPVCHAVQHAHQKGIIHRDLKPSNVLIALYDGKPVPKVIDFGVAKALHQPLTDRTLITELGILMGTPQYMAPEQAEVNALDIDTRADIYSLGVIVYELLTGRTPFDRHQLQQGDLIEMLRVIREVEPPTPSKKLTGIDKIADTAARRRIEPKQLGKLIRGDLDWIVMKCLDKERSRRYETATGLVMDLEHYLHDEPVSAGRPSKAYRVKKFIRRNKGPVVVGGVMLALVVTTVITLAFAVLWHQAETARQQAEAARNELSNAHELLQKKNVELEEQRQLIRRAFYGAQIDLADLAWQDNRIADMRRILESLPGEDPNAMLRSFEWYSLRRLCDGDLPVLRGHTDLVTSLTFSPSSRLMASGSRDATVRLWDTITGQEISKLEGHAHWVNCVTFSPDGKALASGSRDMTVRVWDLTTGQAVRVLNGHIDSVNSLAFSPDGKLLVSGSSDGTTKIWKTATGQEVRTLDGISAVGSVALSSDGKLLALGTSDEKIRLWDATIGKEIRVLKGHASGITSVAFSPDSKLLGSGSWDNTVKLWDVTTGQEIRTFKGTPGSVVAFRPDGKLVASGGCDGTVTLWNPTTGQEVRTLKGNIGSVNSLTFSPDCALLALGGDNHTIELWDITTDQEVRMLKGHTHPVYSVAFSPDARVLASGSGDNTVTLWDPITSQELIKLAAHTER